MFGLYDIEGILRFTGSDIKTCIAYAELLEIRSGEYSLVDLEDSQQIEVKELNQSHHQVMSNN